MANLLWAMNHEPASLEPSHRHLLSWEAATDRLLAAALMTKKQFLDSTMITDRFMMWLLESVSYKYVWL